MIQTKRVIFMVLPLLLVPVVYSISSTPDACAVPPDKGYRGSKTCAAETTNPQTGRISQTCCWTEIERGPYPKIGTTEVRYCQTCTTTSYGGGIECKPKVKQLTAPTTDESVLPGDGVLEQPEPPLFGENVPPTGGIEQPPTTPTTPTTPTLPPLFGRNEGAVPPTGGIEQDQPFIQSETPPTLSPIPTPPPPLPPPTQTGPTVAPQDSQDDEGGGLPATQNQENVPLDDGIAEQPEDEESQNEDDGQEEGAETAGPLT